MARPFLETLDLSPEQVDEICYGIAIHVDDQADFPGERSPLALSIGDADNIDRFDVYRIHEQLSQASFLTLPYGEQLDRTSGYLSLIHIWQPVPSMLVRKRYPATGFFPQGYWHPAPIL